MNTAINISKNNNQDYHYGEYFLMFLFLFFNVQQTIKSYLHLFRC